MSQLLSERGVMVTFALPLGEESKNVWDSGATPVWVLKVSCCGVATTVLVCALAVSKQLSAVAISPRVRKR